MKKVLSVDNIGITFGGLHAIDDVSFYIKEKSIMGLIGPNGAGKTTIFNVLTGVYTPNEGTITLGEDSLEKTQTYKIVQKGIGRTFQNIRLFKELTVLDNVKVALHNSMTCGALTCMLRLPKYWKEEKIATKKAMELLEVFDLAHKANVVAQNLPYGQQRKLEIARALATNPKLLLLDEPAAGMNHTETKELMDTISLVRDKFGVSILLIEHDMNLVMGICEHIVVLDYGKVIAQGSPEEIRNNERVIGAYLGS